MSGETRAKAEVALMGRVVVPTDNKEAEEMIDYILQTVGEYYFDSICGENIVRNAFQYSSKPKAKQIVYGLCVNTLNIGFDKMKCITVIVEAKKNLHTPMGVYCWVENLDAPDCSELGCCFFKQDAQGFYKRIG
jgi:hypothetical protein